MSRLLLACLFLVQATSVQTALATTPVTEPVIAMIRSAFNEGRAQGEAHTICIESAAALDFMALETRLATVHLRPVPIAGCSGERVSDPNPLIGSRIRWVDEDGRPALWMRIVAVNCASSLRCEVDADFPYNGFRYTVERAEGGWSVTAKQSRWMR